MRVPSMDMKKDELLALAEDLGLDPDKSLTKAELIEMINSAEPVDEKDEDETPSPKPEKKASQKADKNEALQNHPKFDKFKPKGENNP